MAPPAGLFSARLVAWQRRHGRHGLPWQNTTDPYRVWVAEIMLQQTQVKTVESYYPRFLQSFADLGALAAATADAVMSLWSGLGYYARARNLHACARMLVSDHHGRFPHDPAALMRLPGIGRSTANAIAAVCFGARVPILDGNVKRLLCRVLGIDGYPGQAAVESRLWQDAAALLPTRQIPVYLQAQMDMGTLICTRTRPRCDDCPVADLCVARREHRIGELPTPRPRRQIPRRESVLLVLLHGDRLLLEKRPATGIWGGLLSLPELPEKEDIIAHCRDKLGVSVDAVLPAPTICHCLTHLQLDLCPMWCKVNGRQAKPRQYLNWVRQADLELLPLPAPIRKILSAFP